MEKEIKWLVVARYFRGNAHNLNRYVIAPDDATAYQKAKEFLPLYHNFFKLVSIKIKKLENLKTNIKTQDLYAPLPNWQNPSLKVQHTDFREVRRVRHVTGKLD